MLSGSGRFQSRLELEQGNGSMTLLLEGNPIEHAEQALRLIVTIINGLGVLTDGQNVAAEYT